MRNDLSSCSRHPGQPLASGRCPLCALTPTWTPRPQPDGFFERVSKPAKRRPKRTAGGQRRALEYYERCLMRGVAKQRRGFKH